MSSTIRLTPKTSTLTDKYSHIKDQFKGAYKVWCWTCVALWSSDYVIRLVRIVFVNYKVLLRRDTPAIANYSQDTDMIRLQVYVSSVAKTQTPGKYYFLYFGGMRFWQSHPFSLAGVSAAGPLTQVVQTFDEKGAEKQAASTTTTQVAQANASDPYLTFMIRPRTGMTRNLRDLITAKDKSGQCRLRVILEGPYGSAVNLSGFNNILFIAGGSGISAVIPYIRQIFEDGADTSVSNVNVRLVWAVRKEELVRDVLANDLCRAETYPNFTQAYYVASNASGYMSAPGSTDAASDSSGGGADDRFMRQRLRVDGVVHDYLAEVQGSTAVFICAPAKMADDARVAVIDQAKQTDCDVQLFEEMYGW